MEDPQEALRRIWGFDDFRGRQRDVVDRVLAGHSTLAVLPTGAGKSLTYQLPAVLLDGLTLVLSPLKALMKDQVDNLPPGVRGAKIDSSMSHKAQQAVLRRAKNGDLDLLFVAPERIPMPSFQHAIADLTISMLVIDEAHCMSEWGHDFRPDYIRLPRVAKQIGAERVLCLTATAPALVREEIRDAFDMRPEDVVLGDFRRSNLMLRAELVENGVDELESRVVDLAHGEKPLVVYASTRRTTQSMAEQLIDEGFDAYYFHAGLDEDEKHLVQEDFMEDDDGIVCCTVAFGMGVDKANIRQVVHRDLPRSLESYVQEIGRAGRDGLPSTCTLLLDPKMFQILRNRILGDVPIAGSIRGVLKEIFEGKETRRVLSAQALSRRHQIKPESIRTLLAYLEEAGHLLVRGASMGPDQYRVRKQYGGQPLGDDVRAALDHMDRFSQLRSGWRHVQIGNMRTKDWDAWRTLASCEAIQTLERHETEIEILETPSDLLRLTGSMHDHFVGHESRAKMRLGQVWNLFMEGGCIWEALAKHFDFPGDGPCGHCGPCIGDSIRPRQSSMDAGLTYIQVLPGRFVLEHPKIAQKTPDLVAAFLSGKQVPALARIQAQEHPDFGCLERMPESRVSKSVVEHWPRLKTLRS